MVLSGPSSWETKACVSMTTLRWDPLSAIDSSQSGLSAEGGNRDKERFNSICSERLLAPHVNRMSRLHSELHRSKALKSRNEGENYVVTAESSLVPRGVGTLLFFSIFHFNFIISTTWRISWKKETAHPSHWSLIYLIKENWFSKKGFLSVSRTVVFNATAYCKYGYCKKT